MSSICVSLPMSVRDGVSYKWKFAMSEIPRIANENHVIHFSLRKSGNKIMTSLLSRNLRKAENTLL